MEAQKQAIIPGIISIVIFSLLFFIVRNFYQEQFENTQKELLGIKNISTLHNVRTMIKENIFLNKIDENLKNKLEYNSSIQNAHILLELKKIDNKILNNALENLIDKEKNISKERINEEYISILELLENEKFHLSDELSLFLEPQRDISFLISIAIRLIPETLRDIENLYEIGLNTFHKVEREDYNRVLMQNSMGEYSSNIKSISQILKKAPATYSKSLDLLLQKNILEFKSLQMITLNIQQGINEQNSVDYFLKLSKIDNSMNIFFTLTKEFLIDKLQDREQEINFKIDNGTTLYILVIILTILFMFRNYNRSKKLLTEISKKHTDDKYVALLKETLLTSTSLKRVCEMSINQLVKKFGAVSGIIYIYDDNNYKLYLGGTSGLDPLNMDCTICVHDNLIGDCIIDRQLKITQSDIKLIDDTKKINIHELVTIPLINLDKSIGAVQLYFTGNFDYTEINFLKRVVYIVSNNIYQSEQDNKTEHYLKLIDNNIMVIKSDLNGDIVDVSEEFCNLSGFTKEEIIGKNHRIFKHEDTPQILYVELWETIKKGLVWRGEIKNRKKNGGYYWAENIIVPNLDLNGNVTGYTGIKHDITSKKKVEELSRTDALTNLYNRRYFDEIFKKKLLIAIREEKKVALSIIDIDYFKQYNDTYGHQEGDKTLIAVANRIKSIMSRPNDYCFRIGGEEFAMLYYYKDKEKVINFSNKIRGSIENLHIPHSGHYSSNFVTISIGVKLITMDDLNDSDNAYREADKALYEAKNKGRNRVEIV